MDRYKMRKIWWVILLVLNVLYLFIRYYVDIDILEKYDKIFIWTLIILLFYPFISEIKIGSVEIKKEIEDAKGEMLHQILNIRQDILSFENQVVQSNGQNVNIEYRDTKSEQNGVDDSDRNLQKIETFVFKTEIEEIINYIDEYIEKVDMKDFKCFLDTDYYKSIDKDENYDIYLCLFVKANSDIIKVIESIGKILDLKTKLVFDCFEKINAIGILTEKDAFNFRMCYLISVFSNFYTFNTAYCNFITHVLPPILYNLRTFYERYSSFIELSQEERKQAIIEIRKRNEEDSDYLEEYD